MSAIPPKPISPGIITLQLAGLVAIMPFAIDVYLPAMAAMAVDFGTSVHLLEQTLSSFYIGIAIGSLIGAPISDRLGRRFPIISGLVIFIIASAIIIWAGTSTQLIAWRFVQALGAGMAVVNAAAIVRDLFDEVGTARLFANIAVVMMIAPLVSPLIGAFLLNTFGWPTIFGFLAIYGIVVLSVLYFSLPETRGLRRKPIAKYGYQHVLASTWSNLLALSLAFTSVCFFLYLTDSSFIFLKFYGLSPTAFAWLFGSGVLVMIGAHRINHRMLNDLKPRRILLYSVPLQTIIALALFLYCQLDRPNMWILYCLIIGMAGVTQIINSNGLAIYLALHPDHAGKANAILVALRFGIGGLYGFLLSHIHAGHPITFATLALSTSIIGCVLFLLCRTKSEIFSVHNTR